MLIAVAARRGCASSLSEAFGVALDALEAEDRAAATENTEIDRLRTITDGAIAMLSLKRVEGTPALQSAQPVNSTGMARLLQLLALKGGSSASFSWPIQTEEAAVKLAAIVYESKNSAKGPPGSHAREVAVALRDGRGGPVATVARALAICAIGDSSAASRPSFVLMSAASRGPELFAVSAGVAQPANLAEAAWKNGTIISLKLHRGKLEATALVRKKRPLA